MASIINGDSPSITFSDSTTQTTAFTTNPIVNNIRSQAATPLTFGISATERMRVDNNGVLCVGTTTGIWTQAGAIQAVGITSHAGSTGAYQTNGFNLQWTGSPALWVDTSNLGNISVSSDYRIKRNIETQTESGLEKVLRLRPVTYQMADYGDLFKASDEIKEGFIAHEVQEAIPSGAEGQKDEQNRIQNLRVDAILSVAVKAIQELNAKVDAQAEQIKALVG